MSIRTHSLLDKKCHSLSKQHFLKLYTRYFNCQRTGKIGRFEPRAKELRKHYLCAMLPPPSQVNLHENVVDDLANNAPVMDRGLRQLADGPLEIGKIFLTTLGSWAQQLEYRPFNQAMSLNPAWRLAYFFLIGITYFIVQGL